MAVARPELTVPELEWVVSHIDRAGKPPHDKRRGVRELRRALRRAQDAQAREAAHMDDVRRAADERFAARGL